MSAQLINLLQHENVDWDDFKLQMKAYKEHHETDSTSRVLLAAAKKSNVPIEIIRHLARFVKLKTLKKVFECACSRELKEAVLEEMSLTTSLAEALIGKAMKCNDLDAIHLIHDRISVFLSHDFYRGAFGEYDAFHELCRVLISHDLLHEDLVFGSQMLHAAAFHGHTEMVNLVLRRFPGTLSQIDAYGNLPLHYACENQNVEAAILLLREGLDMAQRLKVCHVGGLLLRNKSQKSPLRVLCGSGADGKRVKSAVCLVNAVDLARDKRYSFPDVVKEVDLCHLVARHGDLDSMELLLREAPFCVRWSNQLGEKPMTVAFKYEFLQVAAYMYKVAKEQRGINHNQLLREAMTVALDCGVNPDLFVPFVMQIGVDTNQLDECLLLHYIAANGTVSYASLLVEICPMSLLLMTRDRDGSLPIHFACRKMNLDMIKYLLCCARDDENFGFRHGGLLTCNYEGTAAIKDLLDVFNDVDDNIFHVSKCIATCMDVFPDLPILHYILSDVIFGTPMVHEFIRIFNPNPTVQWIENKTAILLAIDSYHQFPFEGNEQQLRIILAHDRSYRSKNHVTKREGRNPLHYSVAIGLKWDPVIKMLVDENYLSLLEPDLDTCCVLPFMLAASCENCNLEVIYCLIRTEPSCLERNANFNN